MKLQRLQTKLQTINPKPKNELRTSWRDGKSSTQRGYGYKWQQYRLKFLQLNPLCTYCERQGLVTEATVVDHIKPHKGDKQLFWDTNNQQSLCASCHSSVKQSEENQYSNDNCSHVVGEVKS
ncbi:MULTISPECIES: HNH endonuclease [unclassified Acinetobacter]|uniref:HNH endonuclease n=1 Tax=unclassified Acinetobacter TaxID=196816 RepID=UPI0009D66C9D|nr:MULTISPECIES: HNH endonuclease signature motif containing protein [unclassified Acinetobacter]WEE38348.1 HNH endonuclease signature motif containing protein [Acinetobacter sp. TAC-1]